MKIMNFVNKNGEIKRGITMAKEKTKQSKQIQWKQMLILVGCVYFVIDAFFVIFIMNIPKIYNTQTIQTVEKIETELKEILLVDDETALQVALTDFTEKNKVELVVLLPTQVVFTTVPTTDFSELDAYIDQDAFSRKVSYEYAVNNNNYQIFLAVYKSDFTAFFTTILCFVLFGVFLLCFIISVLLYIMFQKLVNPLKRLRDNIVKLKDYRLNEVGGAKDIADDYDRLSIELKHFTDDLQEKFESFTVRYTELEKELQAKQEKQNYKERLVTALVHDLKTPLNISNIEVERLGGQLPQTEIEKLEHNNMRVLESVNEVLEILKSDSIETDRIEMIDVVDISRKTLRLFKPLFQKRSIQFFLNAPAQLEIYFNAIEFKQILHNIVANASQYADDHGVFELEMDVVKHKLWIRAYNDKTDVKQIDFSRVFDLFYHINVGDNEFGSGIGMYTIKSMVQDCNGTVIFEPFEQGVQLIIELPLRKEL